MSMRPYKPKVKKVANQKGNMSTITSSSSDSSNISNNSSRDEGFDSMSSLSDHEQDAIKPSAGGRGPLARESLDDLNKLNREKSKSKGLRSNTSSEKSKSDDSSSSNIESTSSSGRQGYAKQLRIREDFNFEPLYLDDSKLGQGKNRHVVSLNSYKVSI